MSKGVCRQIFLLGFGACVFLASGAANASVSDLKAQWSEAANPNGNWSYRQGTSPLGHVSTWQSTNGWSYGQPAWANGTQSPAPYIPAWVRAAGTVDAGAPAIDWQIGDIVVHSQDGDNGNGQGPGNVLWTTPTRQTVQVSGSVWLTRHLGRSVQWQLYKGAAVLTQGNLFDGDGFSRASPMALSSGSGGAAALQNIILNAGESLELRFNTTSTFGEIVGVNLTFNATPVPVPASRPVTLLLMATSLLTAGAFSRRFLREHTPGNGSERRSREPRHSR